MPDTAAFLSGRLKAEGEKTTDFFVALTDNQWLKNVYKEYAAWRVRDVLAHFISAEKSFLALFESIRSGGLGAPEDFSIDRFNISQVAKMQSLSTKKLLNEFIRTRAEMTSWVAALSAEDLGKTGRHPGLGITKLAEMIKMVYLHNRVHIRDLRNAISS